MWLLSLALLAAGCGLLTDTSAQDAQEAVVLLEQRRVAEARTAIADAISQREDKADYHLISAQIEMTAGSSRNAFLAFNNALSLDPSNRVALQGVSRLGLELGRVSDSEKAVEQLLSLEPANIDALVIRGFLHFIRGDYDEALQYAERLGETAPNNEAGAVLNARANFLLDDRETAIATLDRYEETNGVTEGTMRTRLEIGRYESDAEAMANAFAFLLDERPGDLLLKIDYANFLFKRENVAAAIEQVLAVIGHEDANAEHLNNVLEVVQEYDGEAALADVLATGGSEFSSASRIKLARTFVDAGLFKPAAPLLERIAANDAKAVEAWSSYRTGKLEPARKMARTVLEEDRDNCLALIVAAHVALKQGRNADVVRYGQRSASQCSNEPGAWAVTASGFAAKNDAANARRVFRQGIEALPQNTQMTSAYVAWLMEDDAAREAISAARKLTRRAPSLISAWQLYLQVCEAATKPCAQEARAGMVAARSAYGIDLRPGERFSEGLFGRLARR